MTWDTHLNFIDWSRPVAVGVAAQLLRNCRSNPPDLSDTAVLVPTRQAGRSLREALAKACAESSGGLLAPRVLTPSNVFDYFKGEHVSNSGALAEAIWTRLLLDVDMTDYPSLFPKNPDALAENSSGALGWAFGMGARIESLRSDLALGGYTIESLLNQNEQTLEEAERWRDLAKLERTYLARLKRLKLEDRCESQLRAAATPCRPKGIERMVVAAVADPTPLLKTLLANLDKVLELEIIVYAPKQMQACFDGWGCPKPNEWRERILDIADPNNNLLLEEDPYREADRVIELIAEESGRFGPNDITIGVPDSSVADLTAHRLRQNGLETFNPSGRPLKKSPLCLLIETFYELAESASFAALRRFISQPLVLERLNLGSDSAAADILKSLDQLNDKHVPISMESMLEILKTHGERQPLLKRVAETVLEWIRNYESSEPGEFLDYWLRDILRETESDADNLGRWAFLDPIERINEAIDSCQAVNFSKDSRQILQFVIQHLKKGNSTPKRSAPAIELLGWMELLWDNAPFLIVAGMNEGFVPESEVTDIFLPDTLRTRLGLPNDELKLTRDAYFLECICGSRRAVGRAVFICGHSSTSGDPLKPSRLLFRCPAQELAERAEQLFSVPGNKSSFSRPDRRFRLDPTRGCRKRDRLLPQHLSPSAINDYLACPFRFYLKRIAGMDKPDLYKTELDALDYGNLIHNPLKSMCGLQKTSILESEQELADFLERECRREADHLYGRKRSLAVDIQIDSAVRRLHTLAAQQVALSGAGWKIIAGERAVGMGIDGMDITGRIDRIDRHAQSGTIRLIDYKSSNSALKPANYHLIKAQAEHRDYRRIDEKKSWGNLQLPLYQMMLPSEIAQGADIELALFNLSANDEDSGLALWKDFDEHLFEAARACAAGVVRDIKSRIYWPPAEHPQFDEYGFMFPLGIENTIEPDSFRDWLGGGADV